MLTHYTKFIKNAFLNTTEQVSIVEKYVLGNGWTEVGQLQNFIANSKLIIVPSVYASYFN